MNDIISTKHKSFDRGKGWVAINIESTGDSFVLGPVFVNGPYATIALEAAGHPDLDSVTEKAVLKEVNKALEDSMGDGTELTYPMGDMNGESAAEKNAWERAAMNLERLAVLCRDRAQAVVLPKRKAKS